MKKRITISLEEKIIKNLRQKQAKKIKETSTSVSFSAMINQTLKQCIE